jgi:hypothetical protein
MENGKKVNNFKGFEVKFEFISLIYSRLVKYMNVGPHDS